MDKNDLAALLTDAPAAEVDRIYRLLHEWNAGTADSFPVQLALLTKAQWRVAATLPRIMTDSRKLLELHLAAYRRQTQALLDKWAEAQQSRLDTWATAAEKSAAAITQTNLDFQRERADLEATASRAKAVLQQAAAEWHTLKTDVDTQCRQLKQISKDLQDRFAWKTLLWWATCALMIFGLGYLTALAVTDHALPLPKHILSIQR